MTQAKANRTALIIIMAILGLIALALGIPALMPNGAERYTGEQRRAADAQLVSVPTLIDGIQKAVNGTLAYHVENVYVTPSDKLAFWCGGDYDPNKTYYSVEISLRTFFGFETSRFTRHDACILTR